jgi:hypothetical protein
LRAAASTCEPGQVSGRLFAAAWRAVARRHPHGRRAPLARHVTLPATSRASRRCRRPSDDVPTPDHPADTARPTRHDGVALAAAAEHLAAVERLMSAALAGADDDALDAHAGAAADAQQVVSRALAGQAAERDRLACLALVTEPAPHVDPDDVLDPSDVLDVARGTGPPDDAAPPGTDPRHRPDAAARRLLRAPQAPPTSAHADAADLARPGIPAGQHA